jgi:hypothetical protein
VVEGLVWGQSQEVEEEVMRVEVKRVVLAMVVEGEITQTTKDKVVTDSVRCPKKDSPSLVNL